METFEKLRRLLEDEMEKIILKGNMTPSELSNTKTLLEVVCLIDKINEGPEYSGAPRYMRQMRYPMDYYPSSDYDGDSFRSYEYRRGRDNGGYSGHYSMGHILKDLKMMLPDVTNDRDKMAINEFIEKLER